MTSTEIAELVESSICSVQVSLKRLVKDVSENLIQRKLTPEEKIQRFGKILGPKIYVYKLELDE